MIQIHSTLFDHAVLQRGADNRSRATFSGTCAGSGPVMVRVTARGRTVRGLAGTKVGQASGGSLKGCLKGLPAGGPYDIELTIGDEKLRVRDVLVGDVWLLGGQSNMQGVGLLADGERAAPLVRNWYMDDRWDAAREHLHNMSFSIDPVHKDLSGGVLGPPMPFRGVCPGIPFANKMLRLTGVPQATVACGHGGTSMAQWDPKRRDEGGKSLYGAMIRRFRKIGGKVAGFVWYQGESDANPDVAKLYTERMIELVACLRRDCGDARLPVAIVQISRVVGWPADTATYWNSIQDQERRLPGKIKRLAVVPAIDLQIDDCIHIGGRGQTRLGRRLAQAMHVLREGKRAGKPPIALRSIKADTVKDNSTGVITVTFDNVEGELQAGSRPWGFTVGEKSTDDRIYDVRLEGNKALLYTTMPAMSMEGWSIWYGAGASPYCNITDSADRSLPVFGPMPIGEPRALTTFVRKWRVSSIQPSAGRLERLTCPKSLQALGLQAREFPADFADRHPEWKVGDPDALVWYACRFRCNEPMELTGLLGYDGPVKAWLDGREVFHDPNGINPAMPDQAKFDFACSPGEHEALVALATNGGRAWGVYFRMQRRGVSKERIMEGPWAYKVPELCG